MGLQVIGDLAFATIRASGEVMAEKTRVIVTSDPDLLLVYTLDRTGQPVLSTTTPYSSIYRRSPHILEFVVDEQPWEVKRTSSCACGSKLQRIPLAMDLQRIKERLAG